MERVTRTKAIRLKCLDCCCGSSYEVSRCVCRDCPLWPYRLGYEVDEEGNRIARHGPPQTGVYTASKRATDETPPQA